MDDPSMMPKLQAYLQSLEKRVAALESAAGKPAATLFSTVSPPPPPDKTAGWGC
jgi:hypothetical protein